MRTAALPAEEAIPTGDPRPPGGVHLRPARLDERWAELLLMSVGMLAVAGATVFVVWQLRLGLVFSHNLDVGGDNGGHVAAPYFLVHHLLPHGRITGWDPWWFDGMPLYVFYFPLPAVLVAVFDLVLPYNEAFNLVTILGSVFLPVCAWAFGHLAGFKRPVAVLMALSMLPYLFNTSYTIDGGNVTSTMAGEFSFSLALCFGLLFLGVFCYALRTGRLRWLAAVLFAATMLCHMVPALAFAGLAALFALSRLRVTSLRIGATIGVTGALLAGFWLIPFGVDLQYSSSMGYLRIAGVLHQLVPDGYLFLLVPAAIGVLAALLRRDGYALAIGVAGGAAGGAFVWLPSGLVYNGRWLPFWFLFASLMAAYGVGAVFSLAGRLTALPRILAGLAVVVGGVASWAGAAAAGGLVGAFPLTAPHGNQIQVQGWVSWNYEGFQGKSGWPQFEGLVSMLDRAGRSYGCGRLQYEYISETTDPFGSTEAMMSLPMWTHGCMETTDGIYFESSTTTPFHFLNVSEVSQAGEAPNPVSYLDYPGYDLEDGIRHLQLMGVRYFLAMSPPVEAQAAVDPDLVRIAETPGFAGTINSQPVKHPVWQLYLIRHSSLVTPLSYLPEVEPTNAKAWLDLNLGWYEDESYWPVPVARAGPASWPHAKPGTLVGTGSAVPVVPTAVSDVRTTDSSISFHVSRTGLPVLVKIPYFPNWQATGASGPYEVSPNLMAVVPTSTSVALHYGTTGIDWAGKGASVLGLGAAVALGVGKAPNPGAARGAEATGPSDAPAGAANAPAGPEGPESPPPPEAATPSEESGASDRDGEDGHPWQ